ncbi:MAG: beta-aspartyl-peptidase [Deltaproteobacteria bacterium]|nr:beta-aspartyl-peptidase [Deltaproteobacteria bacterium]
MSFSLAVHGGAGSPPPGTLDPASEARRQSGLRRALETGAAILEAGGAAMAAVVAAVESLEGDPVFNAGRGSVYAADRTQRMDASVMDGATRRAGAICDVQRIASPIRAALAVAEHSPHVLLVGAGAESFAARAGLALVDPAVFHDAARLRQLEDAMARGVIVLDHSASLPEEAGGTVGAVARDASGHLAAATSTGGMTGKAPGRVGDSAVIGAGTWADDQTCAISATGHGERFIESHVAGRIACLIELAQMTLENAVQRVVYQELPRCGGEGGVIAVDRFGNIAMPFNSGGMACGAIHVSGRMEVFGLSRS